MEVVDLHPFQDYFLSFISSEEVILLQSLVPFCQWHEPHHPCLCWLAVRARSDRHLSSLWWWSIWPGPPLMPCLKSTWIHKVLSCFLRVHLNVCITWRITHINNNCETLLWCLLALFSNICSLGDLLKGIASAFCITCFLRTYLASFKIWKTYAKSDVKSLMRPVVQI